MRASCEYWSGGDLDESEVHEKAKELAALISKFQESLLYGLSRLAGDGGLPSEDDMLAMELMPPFSFSCLDENENGAARAAFKDACKALSKLSGRMSEAVAGGARDILEQQDERLLNDKQARKAAGLQVERRMEKRSIFTLLGHLEYRRTYYHLKDGGYCHPAEML